MLASETATPILDSGVLPRGRSIFKRILFTLLGLIIGILLGLAVVRVASSLHGDFSLLAYFAVFFLGIAVHECGHIAIGWLMGFHFAFFSVGPLSIRIEYGRLKISLRSTMPAAGYAGMHIDSVLKLRRRMLFYVAGGPGANLLCALVAKPLLTYVFPTPSYMRTTLGEFLLISLVLGLSSLIPWSISDGSRIVMLLFARERARRWLCTVATGSLQRKGIRPRYWKQTWIKAATSRHDSSFDELCANLIAYISAVDSKDEALAGKCLETCLKLAPIFRIRRDVVVQEATYFAGWFRRNHALAEKWRAQIKKPKYMTPLQRIRLDIAVSTSSNSFDAAMKSWYEGSEFIGKLPATPVRARLEESWQEWHVEIMDRQSQSVLV